LDVRPSAGLVSQACSNAVGVKAYGQYLGTELLEFQEQIGISWGIGPLPLALVGMGAGPHFLPVIEFRHIHESQWYNIRVCPGADLHRAMDNGRLAAGLLDRFAKMGCVRVLDCGDHFVGFLY
jgi:hypothetical protein